MTKVKCADLSCKYNNGIDTCKAKEISLSWSSVMTVWDGRQEFLRCKVYEKSDEFLAMQAKVAEIVKQGKGIV